MKSLSFPLFCLVMLLVTSCRKQIFQEKKNVEKNTETARLSSTTGISYYVSPTGNNNNNGTSATTPWQSIAKVNARSFAPGDQVLFEGGKTFSGNMVIMNSGTASDFIRFGSYGTGKAIINGGTGTGIYVYNNAYILIDNLVIHGGWLAGSQTGNSGYGIFFYTDLPNAAKLGTVNISNCDISGFMKAGIYFLGYPADKSQSGYSNISITGNAVYNNGHVGISTIGNTATAGSTAYAFTYVYAGHNKVYNNLGLKSNTSSHSGDGILIGDAAGGLIEYNSAHDNGWNNSSASGGPAAIWCYDSKNIIFQYNEAHHNGTGTGKPDGDGFDLDGGATNCTMQYNYSHDNYGAGFLVWEYGNKRITNSGNIIRYNISQNDNTNNNYYAGIVIGPNCNNNLVYNNTIYSSKGSCVNLYGGANNHFYNNIFVARQSGVSIVSTSTTACWFFNNNYYNPYGFKVKRSGVYYTTLSSFRVTGNEKYNSINYGYSTDPKLSNPGYGGAYNNGNSYTMSNYNLMAGSSMVNAAYNINTWNLNPGVNDFRKASIPYNGAYDIGACELH